MQLFCDVLLTLTVLLSIFVLAYVYGLWESGQI